MPPEQLHDPGGAASQAVGSILKSCRDIMRKDRGLSTDVDRLPQLVWMMFLKLLDDLDREDEAHAVIAGEKHRPLIDSPYRWQDWASDPTGITGDELTAFINNDEALLPDGSRGPGLIAYLKSLRGKEGGDRRDIVARVFSGAPNRMLNGYLTRDVISKLDQLDFASSEELFTISAIYEGMLQEMRDAAQSSGEFYTPRPLVRLLVGLVNPRLGEVVLDPASGTGGFLVEAFEHVREQVETTDDYDILQRETIRGNEAKPLPYLLCEMNLMLHGVDVPDVDYGNSLRFRLSEIGNKERVDVILSNPPFGGEEESSIKSNFPSDMQTSETALLFLQLIMRKLWMPGHLGRPAGRAAVVVPNGVLSGDGVSARVKAALLSDFNLHTIVRLPNGVFSPYTPIPTNVLFFDRSSDTSEIWFYEHPLPEGRKNYTKTKPLRYAEFAPLFDWWPDREENDHAWKVSRDDVLETDGDGRVVACNLDSSNPNNAGLQLRQPEEIVASLVASQEELLALIGEIAQMSGAHE